MHLVALFNSIQFNFSLLSLEGKLVLQQEHTKEKVRNDSIDNMNKTQLKVIIKTTQYKKHHTHTKSRANVQSRAPTKNGNYYQES